jgi:ABC-type transport system involved in multi-copper enzyme maturation permease subunit
MATSDANPARAGQSPSFMTTVSRVFDLSLGEMLWSRRTVFLGLVVAAPIALATVFRVLAVAGRSSMQINGVQVAGPAVFGMMIWLLYLRFIVPVLGVFYGTALIADEVEDKTITYLFTRPISRGSVLIGKYLAYLVCTVLVVLPSVLVVFFLTTSADRATLATAFPALLKDLGLLGLGLAVYGALFALVGAWFKHPLVGGLVFAFGWEQLALMLPGYLRRLTVAYYLQALVPHAMPQEGTMSFLQSLFREAPSPAASVGWLFLICLLSLVLAVRAVGRREYVLDQ